MPGPNQQVSRGNLDRWLSNVVASTIDANEPISLDGRDLWSLLDTLPVAVLVASDPSGTRIVGNIAAQQLLRAPSGANLSQSAPSEELPGFRVFKDGRELAPEHLPMQMAARTGEPVSQSECEIHFDDGHSITIVGHSIPVRNLDGDVCGSIGAFLDVSARMKELNREKIISGEMSHRAKNTISVVQAVARMTLSRHLDDGTFGDFDDRLMSIARFQELASINRWESIELKALCREVVTPIVGEMSARVTISGPIVHVDPGAGSSVAMVLHELTTNACKYGALSATHGRIDLSWKAEPEDESTKIDLLWVETDGPPVRKPKRSGFGTKLLGMVRRQLHGGSVDLDYAPKGVQARIQFQTA